MAHPDQDGHYRILGVAPHASGTAIKDAFRRRSKELHPDRNDHIGAVEQFDAINQAYRVLGNPSRRARYDTDGLARHAPEGGAPGRPAGLPAACIRCRQVTAQPRYVIFHRVIGELTRVNHDRLQGIYCHRCARDVAVSASLITWALGWWGFPDGPIRTLKAIWRNVRGGERPKIANHHLLAYQAHTFAANGNTKLAAALAREAVAIAPDGDEAAALAPLIETGGPALKPVWGRDPLAGFAQLTPAVLVAIIFVIFGFLPSAVPASDTADGTAMPTLAVTETVAPATDPDTASAVPDPIP